MTDINALLINEYRVHWDNEPGYNTVFAWCVQRKIKVKRWFRDPIWVWKTVYYNNEQREAWRMCEEIRACEMKSIAISQ